MAHPGYRFALFDPNLHAGYENPMSFNTFGHLFRVTTFGESHGPAIGCVVDGCPPRIPLTEADIQPYLDKRRPGQSRFTTQRREPDEVKILSGVLIDEATGAQVTTGTPIALLIDNVDQRSKDYSDIKDKYRPGHADYTYDVKYGIRDHRGGGRQSARETAMRVAAGAIARKIVPGMTVRAALIQMGEHKIDRARWSWDEVERNPFFCPDAESAKSWEGYLDDIRKGGSSVGAVIEVIAEGVPAGLGAPIYGKLDGDLAAAMMSINAVKGVEIGAGFAAAALSGEDNADEMRMGNDGRPRFLSNQAGGILGGISTGQPVVCRFAVKPTSSILTPRRTVDRYGTETEIATKGRHDPCVGIRAVPIGEAMVACVIADHYLRHRGQMGEPPAWPVARG
jgi:chorismate synthase